MIIVGLGNPGSEYAGTRHNIGFRVLETLEGRYRCEFRSGRGNYLIAQRVIGTKALVFVKPLTFMNNSGEAVVEVLKFFESGIENLVVIVDDLALPLGAIRLRSKGGDGGHNGLNSIIYSLGSLEFSRIRCGIATETMPPKEMIPDFVLSPFDLAEKQSVESMIDRAADAAIAIVESGIARAMNSFNI